MKINESRPNIETSGDLEEQFFSIQDQGMIFDILRNKMYSNPIQAICREISCNARDAHREVGTPELPVQITLPSNLEPYYKVKDFGPGISPDRMSNIFIKYTASTKRNDNIQTGGFGLGAKTPFSYSDTFTIITNHNGVQYNYACFIDETKVGKLALLSQTKTSEPNGTEILIPVKPADFNSFIQSTEYVTRHWKVKPIIKGQKILWQEDKSLLTGTNWSIGGNKGWGNREVKLIIDEIEYPVDQAALRRYADMKLLDSCNSDVYLYFGVGELSLSASREQVYLDKNTQTKIGEQINIVLKEVRQKVVDKLELFDNLWDVNVYAKHSLAGLFRNYGFLGQLSWKGIPLKIIDNYSQHDKLNCQVFVFDKGKHFSRTGIEADKITRSRNQHISYVENSKLVFNDSKIKEPTVRHIKKLFEEDDKLKSVQVICPSDTVTEQILNTKIHLKELKPLKLSELTTSTGRTVVSTNRLLTYKLNEFGSFTQIAFSSIEEDKNKTKVLCLLESNEPYHDKLVKVKNKTIQAKYLKSLTIPDVSYYGVTLSADTKRVEEEFGSFTKLDDFLEEKVFNKTQINYVEKKYAGNHIYKLDSGLLSNYDLFKKSIKNPNSLFLKNVELMKKIESIYNSNNDMLAMYEALHKPITTVDITDYLTNNPDMDLDAQLRNCFAKYPLLEAVSRNYYRNSKAIIQYVNLIDESLEKDKI
jgi:hypothetical protein